MEKHHDLLLGGSLQAHRLACAFCRNDRKFFLSPAEEPNQSQIQVEEFSQPLRVHFDEASPPVAALKDATYNFYDPVEEVRWTFTKDPVILESGQPLSAKYHDGKSAQNFAIKTNAQVVAPKSFSRPVPKVIQKANQRMQKTIDDIKQGMSFSEALKRRLEKSPEAMETIESIQNAEAESLTEKAKALVEEELGEDIVVAGSTQEIETPAPAYNIALAGPLEISGGLGFVAGQDKIRIFRETFGSPKEEGYVNFKKATYHIDVATTSGSLVAILYNGKGEPKGMASALLSSFKATSLRRGNLNFSKLLIRPISDGMKAKVVSSYSFDKIEYAVEGATALFSGQDDELTIEETELKLGSIDYGSTFQLAVRAPNHWGTLAVSSTNAQSKRFELFADSKMNALLDQVGALSSERNLGVVMGRVKRRGENLQGATVELAGTGSEVIYFNSLMIPDRSLKATSSNGMFAFIGLAPGVYQVRAQVRGKLLPAEVFSANVGQVSHITIDEGTPAWVPLKVVDPIQDEKLLGAELQLIGDGGSYEVDGESLFPLQQNDSLMWIESAPFGSYAMTRLVKPRNSEYLIVPSVAPLWLQGLKQQAGLSAATGSTIVGFVDGGDEFETYQAFLGSDAKSFNYQVVYFDRQGNRVVAPVSRGGFAIFGVAPGMQTVVVVPNAPLRASTHLVIAEEDVISVVQHQY